METRGCLFIADIEDQENSSLWHQGWISAQNLDIHDDLQAMWEGYIRQLRVSNVRLTNRDDKLVWDYHPSGCYTPKHGYIQLNVLVHDRELVWWWKQLWKLKCLGKAKLLFWAILENKAPTWDILQKRFIEGPGYCALCRKDEETIHHLFVQCSFSQTIWTEVGYQLGYIGGWQGDSALNAFQSWWSGHKTL